MGQSDLSHLADGSAKLQEVWKTLSVSYKVKRMPICLPFDPAILFPGIYPREMETYVHRKKNTYTRTFTTAYS